MEKSQKIWPQKRPQEMPAKKWHDLLIDRLIEIRPDAQKTGFVTFVRSLTNDSDRLKSYVIPDAWLFDKSDSTVVAYEVVNTYDVTPEKMSIYEQIEGLLWEESIRLVLIKIDHIFRMEVCLPDDRWLDRACEIAAARVQP